MQLTLAIIKPNVIEAKRENEALRDILSLNADLGLHYLNRFQLSKTQAEMFYQEHAGKPFYDDLIEFMTSGDCIFMILVGESAVEDWRKAIGATQPKDRASDCLRAKYGDATDAMRNGFHGSDSALSAIREYKILKEWVKQYA